MKKKQQMEETMADLKLNNEIISAISKMYRIIYRMDLIHDTYEEISSQESMHRLTGRSGKTSVQFTKAREKFIAPEFQERMPQRFAQLIQRKHVPGVVVRYGTAESDVLQAHLL